MPEFIPANLSKHVTGKAIYEVNFASLHKITKNRLIKVLETGYCPYGWNSKVYNLLELLVFQAFNFVINLNNYKNNKLF